MFPPRENPTRAAGEPSGSRSRARGAATSPERPAWCGDRAGGAAAPNPRWSIRRVRTPRRFSLSADRTRDGVAWLPPRPGTSGATDRPGLQPSGASSWSTIRSPSGSVTRPGPAGASPGPREVSGEGLEVSAAEPPEGLETRRPGLVHLGQSPRAVRDAAERSTPGPGPGAGGPAIVSG